MIDGVILAIFCIAIFLFAHFVILNLQKVKTVYASPLPQYFTYVRLFLIISPFLLVIYILLASIIPKDFFLPFIIRSFGSFENIDFLNGLILYFILSFSYLKFYYIVDRSVSIKIAIHIENSPEKKLTLEQIKKIYDVDNKYIDELNGMVQGGFIIEESGYYKNTFKGICLSRTVRLLKAYLKLGKGG